jgi:RNAse (barnase) inhibitor barstar
MRQHIPDTLTVDVGSVTSRQELHSLLAEVFHFPDYYGQNWDAFDECIRDVELPPHIEIVGFERLRERLPREADLLQHCVADFIEESRHDIRLPTA